MRNWSKPKKTFWQSLRAKATKKSLQLADRIEHPQLIKLKFVESLKLHAEYDLYPRDYDLITCPDGSSGFLVMEQGGKSGCYM